MYVSLSISEFFENMDSRRTQTQLWVNSKMYLPTGSSWITLYLHIQNSTGDFVFRSVHPVVGHANLPRWLLLTFAELKLLLKDCLSCGHKLVCLFVCSCCLGFIFLVCLFVCFCVCVCSGGCPTCVCHKWDKRWYYPDNFTAVWS